MERDRTRDQLDLTGNPVIDARGEPMGKVSAVLLDEWTGRPAWVQVDPGGGDDLVISTLDCSTVRSGATTAVIVRPAATVHTPAEVAARS